MHAVLQFLNGTIRTISFVAWIPVVVGAYLANSLGWGILCACLGSIAAVGFINSFNNLTDRRQDRHDPAKQTLAATNPIRAYELTLYLLPIIAALLRRIEYNNVLLAALFYTGYWYSYAFGRVPYLKRAAVAFCSAATCFMFAKQYPLPLWIWAATVFGFIYWRETQKDVKDEPEDRKYRFVLSKKYDWWCITAPFLGAAIFLGSVQWTKGTTHLEDVAVSIGIVTAIWGYLQIRAPGGEYTVRFTHKAPAGRMGLVVALVGLMPTFTTTLLLITVWVNSISILYRSYLPIRHTREFAGVVHDALLWASLPLLVACRLEVLTPGLLWAAAILFIGTLTRQSLRLGIIKLT